jgi:hypothetical protein
VYYQNERKARGSVKQGNGQEKQSGAVAPCAFIFFRRRL